MLPRSRQTSKVLRAVGLIGGDNGLLGSGLDDRDMVQPMVIGHAAGGRPPAACVLLVLVSLARLGVTCSVKSPITVDQQEGSYSSPIHLHTSPTCSLTRSGVIRANCITTRTEAERGREQLRVVTATVQRKAVQLHTIATVTVTAACCNRCLPLSWITRGSITAACACWRPRQSRDRHESAWLRTPRAVECWRLQSLRGRRRRESLETVTVLFLDNNSPKYNVPNPFEGGDERYAPSWYRTVVGLVVGADLVPT